MTYLDHSREPLRPVVDTAEALQECLSALGGATGPVAFDMVTVLDRRTGIDLP